MGTESFDHGRGAHGDRAPVSTDEVQALNPTAEPDARPQTPSRTEPYGPTDPAVNARPPAEPYAPSEPAIDTPEPWSPSPRWRRFAVRLPLVLVGLTVLFNLWALHPNAYSTNFANDSSVHISMARWAELRISEGHLPFDGWFPYLDLGSPRFHHYQSLPAIATGAAGTVFGTDGVFHWLTYLLLALWPICVYASARLLEWDPWVAAAAAVVSPLLVSQPSLGYEWSSYTWGGYGLYTQLWGMWLMPFSWALTWRAVSGRGSYWPAALITALTIGAHLLTGYLSLLVIGVWVLIKPSQLLRRIGRAAIVGIGSLLAASWMLVPLLVDERWTTQDPFSRGNPAYDSFGGPRVLSWLVSGAIFDNNRFPVVTILAGLGLLVCVVRFRKDERARAILGAFLVSLLLFFGRPTMTFALKFLPGNGDLFLRRYIFGVHLAGIVMAGVGAAWLGGFLYRVVSRIRVPRAPRARAAVAWSVVAVVAIAMVTPAFVDRTGYAVRQFAWIGQQRDAENTDGADVRALVAKAQSLGPGRLFAGRGADWGTGYKVGFVPLDIELLYALTDAVGFNRPTWSLSSSVLHYFDASDPNHYRLFDIRYMIEPADAGPLVPSRKVETRGKYALFEVPNTMGYFEVVDAVTPVEADRTNLGTRMQSFLKSPLITDRRYPTVAFGGAPGAPVTVGPGEDLGSPGRVLGQSVHPDDGRFEATVELNRRALVVLKESFDPRWRVTVDGRVLDPVMVAPSFVGVELPAGRHVVTLEYAPYPEYWLLFLVSAASIVGLALLDRRRRRRRSERDSREADAPPPPDGPDRDGVPVAERVPAGAESPAGRAPPSGDGARKPTLGDRLRSGDQPPASTAAPTAPE